MKRKTYVEQIAVNRVFMPDLGNFKQALRNNGIIVLLSFLLANYVYAAQNNEDVFDKYRQQTLETIKEAPPLPPPPRPELRQTRPIPAPDNNTVASPPSAPVPAISPSAPPPATDKRQTQQPANIWLKPNPWGNTTNNPWAPRQQPATLPNNEKAPTNTPSQGNQNTAPRNIFMPGR